MLAALGFELFRSPVLSADGAVACASCHVPTLGFSGDRSTAVGVGGFKSGRRAPSLLGLRRDARLMWDGRAEDLASQIHLPLESAEMAVEWAASLRRLRQDPAVLRLSADLGSDLDRQLVLDALATYVATLPTESRFDRFYYGHDPDALSEQERQGLRLFTRKAHCSSCHLVDGRAAPFTDGSFHVTGVGAAVTDRGRAGVTGDPVDEGAFKTPSLRGVALRPFLMHDGSVTSLRQAIEAYDAAKRPGIDARLQPLFLTSDEIDAIIAFLGALTPLALDGRAAPTGAPAPSCQSPSEVSARPSHGVVSRGPPEGCSPS